MRPASAVEELAIPLRHVFLPRNSASPALRYAAHPVFPIAKPENLLEILSDHLSTRARRTPSPHSLFPRHRMGFGTAGEKNRQLHTGYFYQRR